MGRRPSYRGGWPNSDRARRHWRSWRSNATPMRTGSRCGRCISPRAQQVTVNDGGQAIVGPVTAPTGGGADEKSRGQPHAPATGLARHAAAGAGLRAMLCPDADRRRRCWPTCSEPGSGRAGGIKLSTITIINNLNNPGWKNGGRGGIRTHGTLTRTAVFKTAALNRSATRPLRPAV